MVWTALPTYWICCTERTILGFAALPATLTQEGVLYIAYSSAICASGANNRPAMPPAQALSVSTRISLASTAHSTGHTSARSPVWYHWLKKSHSGIIRSGTTMGPMM